MIVLDEIAVRTRQRRHLSDKVHLIETRPSILDPLLETEPRIDHCPCCSDLLCLYLHNRPIAIISGTPLEFVALNARLSRLRTRAPRQRVVH